MADGNPERGAPPEIGSALAFPPCSCGGAKCPDSVPTDKEPEHQDDEHQGAAPSDSPTLLRLRGLVRDDNARWGWGH
ncbi:hypothetical protein ACFXPZ_39580 [Streptomyces sp. NPDC059101]|uniref:hypothetical protein n=1 Tax=Streptomyces sp. NPDC059101 TaxID=3346728 RepID=UPI0036A3B3CF